ncbi:MAG: hypothetical protein FJY91_00520 [Candidatus Harrisonbacteria bacterium]|nr:hypothetical protein [Candidatus Harrisonbacteria bacterium]
MLDAGRNVDRAIPVHNPITIDDSVHRDRNADPLLHYLHSISIDRHRPIHRDADPLFDRHLLNDFNDFLIVIVDDDLFDINFHFSGNGDGNALFLEAAFLPGVAFGTAGASGGGAGLHRWIGRAAGRAGRSFC